MDIRTDIADLLHAGLSDRAISRQLGITRGIVTRARRHLELPDIATVQRAPDAAALFAERAVLVDDGHMRWTGSHTSRGTPSMRYGGSNLSAYRIAYMTRWDREPTGTVSPGCGYPKCVAPDHMDDQPMRERNRAAYAALFGEAA